MEIEVLVQFKIENDQIVSSKQVTREFTFTNDLIDVIYVRMLVCRNFKSWCLYEGHALRSIFDAENLYYLNYGTASAYLYLLGDDSKFSTLPATNSSGNMRRYPYHIIPEVYNVSNQKLHFSKPQPDESINGISKLLKYTFGIEFETAGGVIPEDQCFKYKLVPLRDGSIGGIEYATVPLNNTNIGLLKEQIKCLQKYTNFDESCSMHIHFGKLPASVKYHYVLYRLFCVLQSELEYLMPEYTFYTENYKSNGKSYCSLYPAAVNLFDWYTWISGGINMDPNEVEVNLRLPHVSDETGNHKWNIYQRYFAINFINALFYNRNKTVEFRFLKPSYNINYIINWLFIFTAILKSAEYIFNTNSLREKTLADADTIVNRYFISSNFEYGTLLQCIHFAYGNSNRVYRCLSSFLQQLKLVTKMQAFIDDKIGLKTQFHDLYFKSNPIDG